MVKNYPPVSRFYVDLDGPVANFVGKFTDLNLEGSKAKLLKGIFRSLDVVPGAKDGVRLLSRLGGQVWFATKIPDENPHAATEKLLWIDQHFPGYIDRTVITPDKGAIGTQYDTLIDDHPEWANASHFPGRLIVFDSSTTSIAREWRRLIIMLMNEQPISLSTFFGYCVATGNTSAEGCQTWGRIRNIHTMTAEELPIGYGMNNTELVAVNGRYNIPETFAEDVTLLRSWMMTACY